MERNVDPCYTCRNRRIQCDQTGVPCAKCQKAGLECFDKRPVRWVKGVAIRGKMQGRSYESSSEVSRKKENKTVGPLVPCRPAPSKAVMGRNGNEIFMNPLVKLPAALQDPLFLKLDGVSRYYMDYYNARICQLFIVYDSDKNPFRSLIPLGLKDPILLKALLALAARHHANTGHDFYEPGSSIQPRLINANRDALLFKHQAMEALSRAIQHKQVHKDDSTVASIFLLIFLDLLESGSDGWNYHLEGAKKLIDSTYLYADSQALVNHGPGETVREIRNFISKQIQIIETLGATFLRPRVLSQFASFEQHGLQQQETIECSFIGCPEYLIKAIQCLSTQRDTLAVSPPVDQNSIDSQVKDTASLLEIIRGFDCDAWASSLQKSRTSSSQEMTSLSNLSQAYKIGSLIYGQRVLDVLTGETTAQDQLVSTLLGVIDSLKDDQFMFKCILWPIFVAGLECHGQAQRDFLVNSLEKFWVLTKCLNAVNAAKILQDYWQQKDSSGEIDSQWIFNIGNLGRDWLWI